jgi:ribosomal RNA assembly protein
MVEKYTSECRIPKERVAVLIGQKGKTKRKIQKNTNTLLEISKEGDVIIHGEDNVDIYLCVQIVKAIGRGCNPEIALLLLNETKVMEIVEMKPLTKGSKKRLLRIKSRLIGKEGKARKMLETLTNTHIVVYGKTATIIGDISDVMVARHAIEKLLKGAPHGNVYKYIETQKKAQPL